MKKLWKTVAFLGTAATFAAAGLYLFRRFFGADEELEDFEDDDLFDETDEDEDDIKAFEDDSEIFEDEAPVKADEKEEIEKTDILDWFIKNAERYDNIRILKTKLENAIFDRLSEVFIIS